MSDFAHYRSIRRLLPLFFALLGVPGSRGDLIVLANRTPEEVVISLSASGSISHVTIPTGQSTAVQTDGFLDVGVRNRKYRVAPNTAHYIGRTNDGVELVEIGFSLGHQTSRQAFGVARRFGASRSIVKVPVAIYVDDEEAAQQRIWEPRLRNRMAQVSDVLKEAAGVELDVVAVGRWESTDKLTDFDATLREFERLVEPSPARIAIGFTSQYQAVRGRTHLGGTAGPLQRHILMREWTKSISESERMELLLHEFGHYLGATHSPEGDSVMRPVLGDRQSRAASFRVGFDPVNALIINLVADGLRREGDVPFERLPPETRLRLREIYAEVAKTIPDDPAGRYFVSILNRSGATEPAGGARRVVEEIVRTARINQSLPVELPSDAAERSRARVQGDELTGLYVRQAARIAAQLPKDVAPQSLLIGLAVAFDRTQTVRGNLLDPGLRAVYGTVETEEERKTRLAVLGTPTIRERDDWAQHFAVSAGLSVLRGPRLAEYAGIAKELMDANGGSGFSFGDLYADFAGLEFADRIRDGSLDFETAGSGFTVDRYVAMPENLPEKLTLADFQKTYGSITDRRFRAAIAGLRAAVREAPGYREEVLGAKSAGDK